MITSISSVLIGHLALASIGASVFIAIALLMRTAIRRDAVVRCRTLTIMIPALFLMIPAQMAAVQWTPSWLNWRVEPEAKPEGLLAQWTIIVQEFTRVASSPIGRDVQPSGWADDAQLSVNSAHLTMDWRGWAVALYSAACGVLALNGLMRLMRLARLLGRCRPVTSQPLLDLWHDIARSRDLKQRVRLLQSDGLLSPACWGGPNAAVIVPTGEIHSTDYRDLRFALQHECEHLRRRDWLISALQSLIVIMFWFHPLIWLWSRMLDRDREAACDAVVVRVTKQPHSYAIALLAFCERHAQTNIDIPAPLTAFGSKKTLPRRLHMIPYAQQSLSRSRRTILMGATIALACSGLVAQFALAVSAQKQVGQEETPSVDIKIVTQESGVIKRVQIDAPVHERDPLLLVQQLEMLGHPVRGGSLTDQETLASASNATIQKNVITAQKFNLALPEGSKLKAIISGDRVTVTREESKSKINVANGRIELIDRDNIRRVLLRPEPSNASFELSAAIENDEVVFIATASDASAKLRLEFDRTTGVPQNEEQPPHGAVRYDLQPASEVEDKPTRLKMQWIYDASKLRSQLEEKDRGANALPVYDQFGYYIHLEPSP